MSIALILGVIVVVLVILVLVRAIRIVPEYQRLVVFRLGRLLPTISAGMRSEEHTSELQSPQ